MKVLIINTWIAFGGGEQVCLETANFLQKKNNKVSIACCYVDQNYLSKKSIHINFITPLSWIEKLCKKNKIFLALLGFPALFVLVMKNAINFDLINSHNFPGFWVGAVSSILYKKKLVWHFNEPQPIPKFLNFVDKIFIKKVSSITVLDIKNKLRVKKMFGKDAILIRPGVDFKFWSSKVQSDEVLQKYELKDKIFILSVGKIHPQKNQIILVDVLNILKEKIPGLILVLTGLRIHKEDVEERAKKLGVEKRVVFTGIISSEDLKSLYKNCLAVCFPALDQTWGLTPFEALCQKTVSIASSQAGVLEVIGPEKIGLIADPDAEHFAEKILYLYNNKKNVSKMSEKGYNFVNNNMSWDKFGEKMLEIFMEAVTYN